MTRRKSITTIAVWALLIGRIFQSSYGQCIQANRFRTKLIEETNKIFNNYDIIISPSFGKNQLLITNLTGHPAISIPNGLDENNRPTSITFIANYYQEDVLLSFVDLIQKETNHHLNKPPLFY